MVRCVAVSLAYRSKVVTAHGGHKAAMCLLCIHTCVSNETLPPHSPSLPQSNSNLHICSPSSNSNRKATTLGGSSGAPLIKVVQGEPVMAALHCGCVLQSGPAKWRDNYQLCLKTRLNWIILLDSGWLSILLCGRHMEWKAANVSLAVSLSR